MRGDVSTHYLRASPLPLAAACCALRGHERVTAVKSLRNAMPTHPAHALPLKTLFTRLRELPAWCARAVVVALRRALSVCFAGASSWLAAA